MGLNKNYSGYKSFDYLEKDIDYKTFKMVKEIDRVEPYLVPLSASEEERVNRIASENLIISLHDHPQVLVEDFADMAEYSRTGRRITAYEALSKSCLDCVFDNLGGSIKIMSKSGWKWDDTIYDLGMRLSDIAHQDFVNVARRVDDILRAQREGKIALVFSVESVMLIENEVDRIDILYGLGLRSIGLVYSDSNAAGTGLKEDRDGGLTDFGRKCVERLNKLGMLIDTAHCSPLTTLDAVEASNKPVISSHIGARALCDIKRLAPDNVIRAIADKGGIIAIEAAPHTTLTKRHPDHNIESIMEHFEYIKNLAGIDHVAFGPDTMHVDHVGYHHHVLDISKAFAVTENEVPYVKGAENPTECFWNFPRWLVKHGYSDEDIVKVMGGNIIRVLKEVWY